MLAKLGGWVWCSRSMWLWSPGCWPWGSLRTRLGCWRGALTIWAAAIGVAISGAIILATHGTYWLDSLVIALVVATTPST